MAKKRNLKLDAEFCEIIRDTPVKVIGSSGDGKVVLETDLTAAEVALYLRESREGWPAAIQRALSAEGGVKALSKEVEELRKERQRLIWLLDQMRGHADE